MKFQADGAGATAMLWGYSTRSEIDPFVIAAAGGWAAAEDASSCREGSCFGNRAPRAEVGRQSAGAATRAAAKRRPVAPGWRRRCVSQGGVLRHGSAPRGFRGAAAVIALVRAAGRG